MHVLLIYMHAHAFKILLSIQTHRLAVIVSWHLNDYDGMISLQMHACSSVTLIVPLGPFLSIQGPVQIPADLTVQCMASSSASFFLTLH